MVLTSVLARLIGSDSFQVLVAADKITAVVIPDFLGDKGNVMVGEKQHVFCNINACCCDIFLARHAVSPVKV